MDYIDAKTIVTRTKSTSWFGCDYNMNIYRGCNHGCIYCDSRSQCYGIDKFDSVCAKNNALEIIRNDLRRKVKTGIISTGAMSDPYNYREKEHLLTRHALELIDAYDFGVAIATKSCLIERDIDILCSIKQHSPVICKITITSSDDEICRKIEPNAPSSTERFNTINILSNNGIFSGILLMPVLPFITDGEKNIISIVEKARVSGARFIYPAFGMTLRDRQREWYYKELDTRFGGQGLKEKYIKRYRNSYSCTVPNVKKLWGVFKEACNDNGILYDMRDIVKAYKMGYGDRQISLF